MSVHSAIATIADSIDESLPRYLGAGRLAEVYSTLTGMPGIEAAAAASVVGGGIYDAILGHSALKAKVQNIYTWNVKHFKRLSPSIAGRVRTP